MQLAAVRRVRAALGRRGPRPVPTEAVRVPAGLPRMVAFMLERFVLDLRRGDAADAPVTPAELAHAHALARAWGASLDLDEVREWLDWCPHVTPDVALELTLAGVTPQQAAEHVLHGRRVRHQPPLWSRVQFGELTPEQALAELPGA